MRLPGPSRAPRALLLGAMLTFGAASLGGGLGCSGRDGDHGGTSERPSTRGSESRAHTEDRGGPVHREPGAGDPGAHEDPESQPFVVLEPAGASPVRVRVEVARTAAETQRGLMFRRHMDPDAGMIFLFARSRQLTFWMHNTYIPLDMVFITSDMRVLGVVENAPPENDDPREVPGVSQFVLEVNAGFAREHGITAGTLVRFENIDDVPPPAAAAQEDEEWEDEE
ncbi:MAG: DUF192 domain-containing protein [Sandaracinaceae bacterium]|nr:DUF192 domain-containing protein [Sandaracinaceae bacterium]